MNNIINKIFRSFRESNILKFSLISFITLLVMYKVIFFVFPILIIF